MSNPFLEANKQLFKRPQNLDERNPAPPKVADTRNPFLQANSVLFGDTDLTPKFDVPTEEVQLPEPEAAASSPMQEIQVSGQTPFDIEGPEVPNLSDTSIGFPDVVDPEIQQEFEGRVPEPEPNYGYDQDGYPIDLDRPLIDLGEGNMASEMSITVQGRDLGYPDLHQMSPRWFNIPSIVEGKLPDEDPAIAQANAIKSAREQLMSGKWIFPNYFSSEQAEAAAKRRSDSIRILRNPDRSFEAAMKSGFYNMLANTRNYVADLFEDIASRRAITAGKVDEEGMPQIDRSKYENLRKSADMMEDRARSYGFRPMSTDDIKSLKDFVAYVSTTVGQSVPYMGTAMLTAGTMSPVLMAGETLSHLDKLEGLSQTDRVKLASLGGAIAGALETIGMGIVVRGVPREIIGRMGIKGLQKVAQRIDTDLGARFTAAVASGTFAEGLTELGQEETFMVMEGLAGREIPMDEKQERRFQAFAAGFTAGGVISTGIAGTQGTVQKGQQMMQEQQEKQFLDQEALRQASLMVPQQMVDPEMPSLSAINPPQMSEKKLKKRFNGRIGDAINTPEDKVRFDQKFTGLGYTKRKDRITPAGGAISEFEKRFEEDGIKYLVEMEIKDDKEGSRSVGIRVIKDEGEGVRNSARFDVADVDLGLEMLEDVENYKDEDGFANIFNEVFFQSGKSIESPPYTGVTRTREDGKPVEKIEVTEPSEPERFTIDSVVAGNIKKLNENQKMVLDYFRKPENDFVFKEDISLNFDWTTQKAISILSSLEKKGILKRDEQFAMGVFTPIKGLENYFDEQPTEPAETAPTEKIAPELLELEEGIDFDVDEDESGRSSFDKLKEKIHAVMPKRLEGVEPIRLPRSASKRDSKVTDPDDSNTNIYWEWVEVEPVDDIRIWHLNYVNKKYEKQNFDYGRTFQPTQKDFDDNGGENKFERVFAIYRMPDGTFASPNIEDTVLSKQGIKKPIVELGHKILNKWEVDINPNLLRTIPFDYKPETPVRPPEKTDEQKMQELQDKNNLEDWGTTDPKEIKRLKAEEKKKKEELEKKMADVELDDVSERFDDEAEPEPEVTPEPEVKAEPEAPAAPEREYKPLLRGAHGKPEEVSVTRALLGNNKNVDIRLTEDEDTDKPFLQFRNIRTNTGLNLALKLLEKGFIKGKASEFQEGKSTAELTPAGITAVKQLRVNSELEEEGLPMKDYRPSTSKKIPLTGGLRGLSDPGVLIAKDKWDGETVFSDGRFALKGTVDLNTPTSTNRPNMDPIIKATPTRKKGEEYAQPVAWTKDDDGTFVHLISADGESFERVDSKYYDFMLKRYPDGKFFLNNEKGKPISFYSKNKKVGILMPLRTDWDPSVPGLPMKGVLDQINQFRQKIGKKPINEPGDLQVTTEGAPAPKLSSAVRSKKPRPQTSGVVSEAAPSIAGSEVEGRRKRTNWWRETYDERVSVQDAAIRDSGIIPELFRQMSPEMQRSALTKMVKKKFGIKEILFAKVDKEVKRGRYKGSIEKVPANIKSDIDNLLNAYANLSAMATLLNLPPNALSLDGRLSLSFPTGTKMKGAAAYLTTAPKTTKVDKEDMGPAETPLMVLPSGEEGKTTMFAHEFGHALDYHLMDTLGTSWVAGGMTGKFRNLTKEDPGWIEEIQNDQNPPTRRLQLAFGELMNSMLFDMSEVVMKVKELEQKIGKQNARYLKQLATNPREAKKSKAQLENEAALERLLKGVSRKVKKSSEFRKDSLKFAELPWMDVGPADYWTKPTELFARAFEAYVAHKFSAASLSTEFVASSDATYNMANELMGIEGMEWTRNPDIKFLMTHPQQAEQARVFDAFDELFSALQEFNMFEGEVEQLPAAPHTVDHLGAFKNIKLNHAPYTQEAKQRDEAHWNWQQKQEDREKLRPVNPFYDRGIMEKTWIKLSDSFFSPVIFSKMTTLKWYEHRYRLPKNPTKQDREALKAIKEINRMLITDPGGKQPVFTRPDSKVPAIGDIESATARRIRKFGQVYMDIFDNKNIGDFSDKDYKDLRLLMTSDPKTIKKAQQLEIRQEVLEAADEFRKKILDPLWQDLKNSGVDLNYIADQGYLPRTFDIPVIIANPQGFKKDAKNLYTNVIFENDYGEVDTSDIEQLHILAALGRSTDYKKLKDLEVMQKFQSLDKKIKKLERDIKEFEEKMASGDLEPDEGQDLISQAEMKLEEVLEENEQVFVDGYNLIAAEFGTLAANDWYLRLMQMQGENAMTQGPLGRFTKSRQLPKETDTVMAKWYANADEAIKSYIMSASRKIEYEVRFGKNRVPEGSKLWKDSNNNKIPQDYLNYLLREKLAGVVQDKDVENIRQLAEFITGTQPTFRDKGWQSFLDGFHAIGTMMLLPKAVLSSVMEPLTVGIQAESTTEGFKALALTIQEGLTWADKGKFSQDRLHQVQLRHQLASLLGIVDDPNLSDIMITRLFGTLEDSPKWAKRSQYFYQRTGLTGVTNAQRRSSMQIGFNFLTHISSEFLNPVGETAAAKKLMKDRAKLMLQDFGVPMIDQEQFARYMTQGIDPDEQGKYLYHRPLPSIETLTNTDGSLTDMGQITANAVGMFVDRSIQDVKKRERPKYAEHPYGRIVYGVTGFIYAFHQNVNKALAKKAAREAKLTGYKPQIPKKASLQELGKSAKSMVPNKRLAGYAAANLIMPVVSLYLGQTLLNTVREFMYNRDRWEDEQARGTLFSYIMEFGIYRSGIIGPAEIPLQAFRNMKWQQNIANLLVGAGPSNFGRHLENILGLWVRNSETTDAAEYQAVRSSYYLFLQSMLTLAIANPSFPGKALHPYVGAWSNSIAFGAANVFTAPDMQHLFARLFYPDYRPGRGGRKKSKTEERKSARSGGRSGGRSEGRAAAGR